MKTLSGVASAARRSPLLAAFVLFSLISGLYWGVIASDRYVSEAHIYLQKTNAMQQSSADLISLLAGSGGNRDLLLLRDHLLSIDMMKLLDKDLHLREHFSDKRRDLLSRLWSKDAPDERFQRYYLSRIDVTYDDYAQVLSITAQAYSPEMARAIAQKMVTEGEKYMNALDHKTAHDQVSYIEQQVSALGVRMVAARKAVLAYQDAHGLVSPGNAVESVSAIASRLDAELSDLMTKRAALAGYLTPAAPDIVQLDSQIAAVKSQLQAERQRMAAKRGGGLNAVAEEQGRLEAEAALADDMYKTALVALETARVESTRKIKSVAVLQSANLPVYPLEPRRIYNILLSLLAAAMLTGVLHLLVAIIRDHRD